MRGGRGVGGWRRGRGRLSQARARGRRHCPRCRCPPRIRGEAKQNQTRDPPEKMGEDLRTLQPFRLCYLAHHAGELLSTVLALSISSTHHKTRFQNVDFPLYFGPRSKNMEPAPAFLWNQLPAFRGPERAQKADPRKVGTNGRELTVKPNSMAATLV